MNRFGYTVYAVWERDKCDSFISTDGMHADSTVSDEDEDAYELERVREHGGERNGGENRCSSACFVPSSSRSAKLLFCTFMQARMVTNLLVTICGDTKVQPTIALSSEGARHH